MLDLAELNNQIATVVFVLSCLVGAIFWVVFTVIIGVAIKNCLFKPKEE